MVKYLFKFSLFLLLLQNFAWAQFNPGVNLKENFKVNTQGASTYTIPITIPDGIRSEEMKPELAFVYNSQSGKNYLGKGWSLSGLMEVSRCNKTFAQDGNKQYSSLFSSRFGKFCFNGQRLNPVLNDQWEENALFKTEIATDLTFKSQGECGTESPCSFIATNRKTGVKMEFGSSLNSRIYFEGRSDKAFLWALTKVYDKNGNYWSVEYDRHPNAFYPMKIQYSQNDALTQIDREITFEYENRNDYHPKYISTLAGGIKLERRKRLKRVNISVDGEQLKSYVLNYGYSNTTHASLINSIDECALNECREIASFTYHQPGNGFTDNQFNLPGKIFFNDKDSSKFKVEGTLEDFNGDGILDYANGTCYDNGSCNDKQVHLGTGKGFIRSNFKLISKTNYNEFNGWRAKLESVFTDFNGDGLIDFTKGTCWVGSHCEHRVHLNNGEGFNSNPSFNLWGKLYLNETGGWNYRTEGILRDFNGDGLLDYSPAFCRTNGSCSIRVYHGTKNGFIDTGYNLPEKVFQVDETGRWGGRQDAILEDFNGDGLVDFARASSASDRSIWLSTGNGFRKADYKLPKHQIYSFYGSTDNFKSKLEGIFADFNGDGLVDFSRATCWDEGNCDLDIYHNTGKGFVNSGYRLPGHILKNESRGWRVIKEGLLADFNGDGLLDFASGLCDRSEQCDKQIYFGTGRGFVSAGENFPSSSYFLPGKAFHLMNTWEIKTEAVFADFNGDGAIDYTRGTHWNSGRKDYGIKLNKAINPDALIAIKSGLNSEVKIEYKPMTNGEIYTKGKSGSYPNVDVQTPRFLVSKYTLSDGIDSNYNFRFKYEAAKVNRQGRGWLGFAKLVEINEEARIKSTRYFHQNFPLQGRISRIEISDLNNNLMKRSRYTYDYIEKIGERKKYYIVNITQIDDDLYLDGRYNYTLRKKFNYDGSGRLTSQLNLGDLNKVGDEVYECYRYQTGSFLASYKKITKNIESCSRQSISSFNGTSDLNLTKFDWDNFKLKSKKIFDDTIGSFVGSTYEYSDTTGSLVALTNQLGATTNIEYIGDWTVKKIYPSIKNGSRLEAKSQYNKFGSIESTLDFNHNELRYDYDSFGRIKGIRGNSTIDGSDIQLVDISYSYCKNRDDCQSGFVIEKRSRNNWYEDSVANWNWSREYYDGLGRLYLTRWQSGDNGEKISEKRVIFDRQGRVFKESIPYFQGETPQWVTRTYKRHNAPESTIGPMGGITAYCYALGDQDFAFSDICQDPDLDDDQNAGRPGQDEVDYYQELIDKIETSANNGPSLTDGNRQMLVKMSDPQLRNDGNSTIVSMRQILNSAGLPTQIIDAADNTVSKVYNEFGQLIKTTDAKGVQTRFTYNTLGQVVQVVDNSRGTQIFKYDSLGRLQWSKNDRNIITEYYYDNLNRVVAKETSQDQSNANIVIFNYDETTYSNGLGRLTSTEWDEGPRKYKKVWAYDNFGRAISTIQVVSEGTSSESFATQVSYLPNGQVENITYPDGSKVHYSYNGSSLLANVKLQESDNQNEFKEVVSYSNYNASGQAESIQFGNGVVSRKEFDVLGRLTSASTTLPSGNVADSAIYHWNKAGKLYSIDSMVGAFGDQDFFYNQLGQLIKATGSYGTKEYQYDESGNAVKLGALRFTYQENKKHLLKSIVDQNGQELGSYYYDEVGNLLEQPIIVDGQVNTTNKKYFTYNLENRLESVAIGPSRSEASIVSSFTYDPLGRRIRKVESDGLVTRYITNAYEVTELSDGKTLHTKNIAGSGGIVAATTKVYTKTTEAAAFQKNSRSVKLASLNYSAFNGALEGLSSIAGQFSASLGTLFPKIVLALLALLMSLSLVSIYRLRSPNYRFATAALIYGLVFTLITTSGPSSLMAAMTAGEHGMGVPQGMRFFHQNHQMSSNVVSNEAGKEVARVAYEPFGLVNTKESTGEDSFRQKYTGKELDSKTGLYYFGSRYYDPVMGRFLTPDPAWQYDSPYIMGANDPLSGTDPDGEFFIGLSIFIGALVGSYFGGVAANGGNYNPAEWDWKSGKTWAGLIVGGLIGGASAGVGAALTSSGAGLGTVVAAEAGMGFADGIIMGAIEGQEGTDLLMNGLIGAAMGGVAGGLFEGAGRLFSRFKGSGKSVGSKISKGCPTSFEEGTLLASQDGQKEIQDLEIGDQVWSFNENSGSFELKEVTQLFTRIANDRMELVVDDETISTTANHPFYVERLHVDLEQGTMSVTRVWIEAKDLKIGDQILTKDSKLATVNDKKIITEEGRVYNLEVEGNQNYFVGTDEVLVHNCDRFPDDVVKIIEAGTTLYHYTDQKGAEAISTSQMILPSKGKGRAHHGDGVYFTKLEPGTGEKELFKHLFTTTGKLTKFQKYF